jgi:disulfide bond formation protein DsbB
MIYLVRYWAITVFLLSVLAIANALIAEFIFHILPCEMCYKQRYPYYFIISIFIVFYFINKTSNIWLYVLTELAVLYGLFYSVWHVGIEQNLLSGPSNCSGKLEEASSLSNLKEQILNQAVINCNEISWSILGLSAATLNSLLLFLLLLFNTIFIFKINADKERII